MSTDNAVIKYSSVVLASVLGVYLLGALQSPLGPILVGAALVLDLQSTQVGPAMHLVVQIGYFAVLYLPLLYLFRSTSPGTRKKLAALQAGLFVLHVLAGWFLFAMIRMIYA